MAYCIKRGFVEQIMAFIKSLYRDSTILIANDNKDIKPIQINQGVRQDCDLSPIVWAPSEGDV